MKSTSISILPRQLARWHGQVVVVKSSFGTRYERIQGGLDLVNVTLDHRDIDPNCVGSAKTCGGSLMRRRIWSTAKCMRLLRARDVRPS